MDNQPEVIDTSTITTVVGVLAQLMQLDSQLNSLELDQFKLFNRAYQVVTRSMVQAIKDDYFKNPEVIEKFMVTFADYYFKAVSGTMSGAVDVAPPWLKLNDYATNRSAPVFISLMLGANAHINNDLPQALKILMQQEQAKDLVGDLLKIDKLLMKSGKEIIGLFEEKNRFLDFLKRRFQFLYYRPAMYTIRYWRIIAWKNYQKLAKDDAAQAYITDRSVKIANRLLFVARMLG